MGVQVDETLSWEAHIFEVVGKVAKVLAALRRLRQICPQVTLVTLNLQVFNSSAFRLLQRCLGLYRYWS